jgi:protein gp37
MGADSKIEWCDHTFNPWIGCTKVSPACDSCYAENWAKRFRTGTFTFGWNERRVRTSPKNWKLPLRWDRTTERQFSAWEKFKATNTGLTDEQMIAQGFIKPRRPRVFCGSLCDVFDNAVPDVWRNDLFMLIRATPNLNWLLLTKRIGNARSMLDEAARCLPDKVTLGWSNNPLKSGARLDNVWLGITACNQAEADRDIPKLLEIPATKWFLSIEPMLGAIDSWKESTIDGGEHGPQPGIPHIAVDWVIVGGETGAKARPMHPDWVRSIRDQCQAAGVMFHFKQMSKKAPIPDDLMIREFPND